PFILMEPGRSIVATEGITLYTVGPIKEIPNVRKYVAVDGGMGDNPRYILYGAKYWPIVANRVVSGTEEVVTIAGRCCESGDLLAKDVKLGEVKEGDILAILSTGAYNYSMSSNYNRIPRPAVVMVKNGESRIIVMRETYEDIIRNDL
ncbi:MAG: diaminopimelate decarboxylase, partial [Clostridiaceae bacterium]|nr:diaminopimelate decarboxylase [Clostridiaceae bacterium]